MLSCVRLSPITLGHADSPHLAQPPQFSPGAPLHLSSALPSLRLAVSPDCPSCPFSPAFPAESKREGSVISFLETSPTALEPEGRIRPRPPVLLSPAGSSAASQASRHPPTVLNNAHSLKTHVCDAEKPSPPPQCKLDPSALTSP